jgi:hypothetical protein
MDFYNLTIVSEMNHSNCDMDWTTFHVCDYNIISDVTYSSALKCKKIIM